MGNKKLSDIARKEVNHLCGSLPTKENNYELNTEAYNRFMDLCYLVDDISEEFNNECDSIKSSYPKATAEVSVMLARQDGVLNLYISELIFRKGRSHPFFEEIKNADILSFSKAKNSEELQVTMIVKNLWERFDW